jgi:hypothetical protein
MAITVRGTSTGANPNGTTTSLSLPTGIAVGDVSFIAVVHASGVSSDVITQPSGWTALVNGAGCALFYRAYQAGDPTTGITFTSASLGWFSTTCIAYTGLDTSSPVGGSNSCYSYGLPNSGTCIELHAPSLNPAWDASQLLCVYFDAQSGGHALTLPSGLTSQNVNSAGPNLLLADVALVNGTPTPDYDSSGALVGSTMHVGVQVELKASGATASTAAAARPSITGLLLRPAANSASIPVDLAAINVQDGDIVAVYIALTALATVTAAPSGYALTESVAGGLLYTHTWSMGDATSLTWTLSGSAFYTTAAVLVRKTGVSAGALTLDLSGSATATSTVASPSLAPSGSNDLLLSWIGQQGSSSGVWSSVTSGLTSAVAEAGGPSCLLGWLSPSPNPSGAFSATYSGTDAMGGVSALFIVGSGTPQAESNIPASIGQLYPRGGSTL